MQYTGLDAAATVEYVPAAHAVHPAPLGGGEVHTTETASVFVVPEHGSPNNPLEAPTTQDALPRHRPDTTAVEVAAAHAPTVNPPQVPVGVPHDANPTPDTVWPVGHDRDTVPPSAEVPHEVPVVAGVA